MTVKKVVLYDKVSQCTFAFLCSKVQEKEKFGGVLNLLI
jgi:hypothetical protein